MKNILMNIVKAFKGLSIAGQVATVGGTAVVAVGLVAGGVYAYNNTSNSADNNPVVEEDFRGAAEASDGLANNLANGGITEEEIKEKVENGEIDETVANEAIAKVEEIRKNEPSYVASSNDSNSGSSSNNNSDSSNSGTSSGSNSNSDSSKPTESKPTEKPAEQPKPAEPAKPTVKQYSRPNWNSNMGNVEIDASCGEVNFLPEVANKSTMSSFNGEMYYISQYVADGISISYLKSQIVGTVYNGHKITNVTREKISIPFSPSMSERKKSLLNTGVGSVPSGNFAVMVSSYDDLVDDGNLTYLKTIVYFE